MMTSVNVWLCPTCSTKLDDGGSIGVDMSKDHDSRRCMSCGTSRLQAVPDAPHGDHCWVDITTLGDVDRREQCTNPGCGKERTVPR